MRVVVDTNVFVSSFFGGNPKKVIDLWRKGEITLCLSKDIVDEYVEVMERLRLPQKLTSEVLTLFASGFNLMFAGKTPTLNIVSADADDNKLFECAVALKAQTIVSGDKAVIGVRDYMGIKVENPQQFLTRMRDA
jgi:putative PIN family toxin of toxin-antitoxin system